MDGISLDRTIETVQSYICQYPFIRLIENPKKIFPAAVNAGYKASAGDVIMIAGAHAVYDQKYISASVRLMSELGADNIGGVLVTKGKNEAFVGRLITSTLSNPFGVGNSTFRTGSDRVCEVDTVFGGCYRKEVFETIGLFNENLISTSDMDFNTRLRKSGGRIFLSPEIKATYYTRSTFNNFIRNNLRNGYWAIYPMRYVASLPVSLRHLIPLAFLCGVVGLALFGLVQYRFWWILALFGILYFLLAFYFSFRKSLKDGFFVALLMPFFFPLLHVSYGIGSWVALCKLVWFKVFRW